jgi:hypothetical protein
MIMALSGRRPDSKDPQVPRFPPANENLVRDRIHRLFVDRTPRLLVTSAASGVDLIALSVALQLGIVCSVVLPFHAARFRERSVTDRGPEWATLFDSILSRVSEIHTHDFDPADGDTAFLGGCAAILDQAVRVGMESREPVTAVAVWDGRKRKGYDVTHHFWSEARRRGLQLIEVSTLA